MDSYIVGYQVNGETIIPLFIKTPKNIFSYCVSQYDKNFLIQCQKCIIKKNVWMDASLLKHM